MSDFQMHRPAAAEAAALPPYEQLLLARLERLLAVAPSAAEHWQARLAAQAIGYTLAECGRYGLAEQATQRLRAAGRGPSATLEEQTQASVS